jgi:hypothetical protein
MDGQIKWEQQQGSSKQKLTREARSLNSTLGRFSFSPALHVGCAFRHGCVILHHRRGIIISKKRKQKTRFGWPRTWSHWCVPVIALGACCMLPLFPWRCMPITHKLNNNGWWLSRNHRCMYGSLGRRPYAAAKSLSGDGVYIHGVVRLLFPDSSSR